MFNFKQVLSLAALFISAATVSVNAQNARPSEESKMVYLYSLDEAKGKSLRTGKPVFVNCYAEWAAPCKAMDKYVFSDEEFAKYMDKNFINVFLDMKSPEGKEFANQHGISSFAYFLVLDGYGNVLQPIGRGGKLDEFKQKVAVAANPSTTLAATQKKIDSNKYSKKDLYNYLMASRVADNSANYKKMINIYTGMLSDKELREKKNWEILKFIRDRKSGFYRNVVENRAEFDKKIGAKNVNWFIEQNFANEILRNATNDKTLDEVKAVDAELAEAMLPDSSLVMIVHRAGMLRAERRYDDLMKYVDDNIDALNKEYGLLASIQGSFNFNVKGEQRDRLKAYLLNAAKNQKGSAARQLEGLANSLDKAPVGIDFQHGLSFADALKMAKKENKLVFVDCYTSWCGPCRALATNVFPLEEVGKCYNDKFINLKIDMENGEGPELAKRYEVSAFPTLLYLDSEGNVVERSMGMKSAAALIEIAEKAAAK